GAGSGGQGGNANAPEGPPIEVLAVVEVDKPFKILEEHASKEKIWDPESKQPARPLETRDHWGMALLLNTKPGLYNGPDVKFDAVQCETVAERYKQQYNQLYPPSKPDAKPSAAEIIKLAEWALTHGQNAKVVELMQKLADVDDKNDVLAAFNQIQADLDKPIKDAPTALKDHLQGYAEATLKETKAVDPKTPAVKGHYVLFHSTTITDQAEVQERLRRLEDALHTYYYWFALNGPDLVLKHTIHVPDERLPVILTAKEDEFKRKHGVYSAPPVVGDGFFARRENVSVFYNQPLDPIYDMLNNRTSAVFTEGWDRYKILSGVHDVGYPAKDDILDERAYAGTLALLLKALEDESERAGASHDATRQLVFASGLLPRGVTVPEWVQFGMGSFFETPEHSPWPSPAGMSTLYLPMFRDDVEGKKFEGSAPATLRKVVTDAYFRDLKPEDVKKKSPELLKARAASWGLMYFLAKKRLNNLQRYFELLGQMPRDLELDDDALWQCFARAFDAYDPKTQKYNDATLNQLADDWQSFVQAEYGTWSPEEQALVSKIHKAYDNLNKVEEGGTPAAPKAQ
ncbi:MAG TPA: DUF1570 domain-containing protein, partial [Gemmataceae bacterium]|nr:DUF1570 domain-containing protein [Gemmataceae bacterium]